ncbi:putative HVA22-like protein g [Rhodamnia argentea]|uniref:HVA22-like protein n=1 Tax=Rhodamnia argentea TaxID=178133 RepID=A0ABM3GVM6_9MYRT|nr:putative HVA22-like protein g [Rhodamnia argentea]
MGSFLSRALLMVFGYAYPAYNCFKTIENNEPEAQQLLFRCQYWILVAFLSVCERLGDAFISWLPLYGEAKFAFFVYLWHPQTKGTQYVYCYFFRPYLAIHEKVIDRHLLEPKVMAGDSAVSMWQKAMSYGRIRLFEFLQDANSPSKSLACPNQVYLEADIDQANQETEADASAKTPSSRPAGSGSGEPGAGQLVAGSSGEARPSPPDAVVSNGSCSGNSKSNPPQLEDAARRTPNKEKDPKWRPFDLVINRLKRRRAATHRRSCT